MGPLGNSRDQSLRIYGPGGGRYGSMDWVRGAWRVNYRGLPVLTLSGPSSGYLLCVNTPDGEHIGTLVNKSESGSEVLVLQVNCGSV